MSRVRLRGEETRRFILEKVETHAGDVSKIAAAHFGVTRQAINKHLQRLVHEGSLSESGKTRNRSYKLAPLVNWNETYAITPDLEEDVVWRNDVSRVLGDQPENVMDIWQYGFTEMFNNAKDHSGGSQIEVLIQRTATTTEMAIIDNGVGIFRKIQTAMNLLDERHAVFELAKGKLTTDPARHSGEGVFFTSRMFDSFDILSAGTYFSHEYGKDWDWVAERTAPEKARTSVWLKLNNHTSRTPAKVFDQFSSGDNYGFNKTMVPVSLAQYGNDKLISRSQARRVVARIDLFKVVIFNFKDVPTIGQAFADEIFRVFAREHPGMELYISHANSEIKRMVARAQSGQVERETIEEAEKVLPSAF
jgi:anti-sigma regulatory factor (Ser/Thr protein kinase)/biotin operon repressor